MLEINLFNSIDYLEPHCPGCGQVLDYGVNTVFDEKLSGHKCCCCGAIL